MTAPAHLSAAAQQAWEEIVVGLDVEPDGLEAPAIEAYATAVGRMRDARTRIDEEGMIVADDRGQPTIHPAITVERAASAEVRKWVERYRRRPRGPRRPGT